MWVREQRNGGVDEGWLWVKRGGMEEVEQLCVLGKGNGWAEEGFVGVLREERNEGLKVRK